MPATAACPKSNTYTTLHEYRNSVWQVHWTQALYLAEAGIAEAQDEFKDTELDFTDILKGADGVADTSDDGLLSFGAPVYLGNGTHSVVVTDNDDGDGDMYADVDQIVVITSTGEITIPPEVTRVSQAYLRVNQSLSGSPTAAHGVCNQCCWAHYNGR